MGPMQIVCERRFLKSTKMNRIDRTIGSIGKINFINILSHDLFQTFNFCIESTKYKPNFSLWSPFIYVCQKDVKLHGMGQLSLRLSHAFHKINLMSWCNAKLYYTVNVDNPF